MFGWAQPEPRPLAILTRPAETPGLGEQLEDLVTYRLTLERRYKTAFAVIDRMAVWLGAAADRHVCPLPPAAHESMWSKTWMCACGQAWIRPSWYTAWQPIDQAAFDNHGHSDAGDECQCPSCRRRRS